MGSYRRALAIIATAIGLAALALLAWRLRNILLIAFAGFVLAVFLRSCARFVARLTRLGMGWSLAIALVLLVGLGALGAWLLLLPTLAQVNQLVSNFPALLEQARGTLASLPWGQQLLEQLPSPGETGSGSQGADVGAVVGQIASTLRVTFSTLADALLILASGIFIAATPNLYRRGLLRLVPIGARARADALIGESVHTVRHWFVGQLVAMAFVGVASWLGLTLLGVPLALVMGVLAGLLDFIPFFGPTFSAVPAILLGLTQGLLPALWVTLLYVVVQQLEGNVVQPLVQRRAVSIPPVLLILSLIAMNQLFGFLGLLLATPFVAVLLVWVKRLYVEGALRDQLPEG